MSTGHGLSFKSSVNAICLWWLVSIGISALIYVLYSLIHRLSDVLRIRVQPQTNEELTFDDILAGLKGKASEKGDIAQQIDIQIPNFLSSISKYFFKSQIFCEKL
jgi:hypothetical protein